MGLRKLLSAVLLLALAVPAVARADEDVASRPTQAGWVWDGSDWYHLNASGNPDEGWLWDNGWYFLNDGVTSGARGRMLQGWLWRGGSWYLLNADHRRGPHGLMATGWACVDSVWFWFDESGVLQTDRWLYDGGNWYYLRDSGRMAVGWLQLDDGWYYLQRNGVLFTGGRTPDGYYVDSAGRWVQGF